MKLALAVRGESYRRVEVETFAQASREWIRFRETANGGGVLRRLRHDARLWPDIRRSGQTSRIRVIQWPRLARVADSWYPGKKTLVEPQ